MAQTFKNLEVIVVDDGSTDNTRDVIEAIKDSRVRYFYKENGGVSSARNFGIAKSEGEYICFLDSDDLWPGNYLEIMIQDLETHKNYDVAYALMSDIQQRLKGKAKLSKKYCLSGSITSAFFENPVIMIQGLVARKNALKEIYFDENLATSGDGDFILRLSRKTLFLYVSDTVSIRRKQDRSLSRKNSAHNPSLNFPLVLERFYYHLGGKEVVSAKVARKCLCEVYRRIGVRYRKNAARKAAIKISLKAVSYNCFNFKCYRDLFRAYRMPRRTDTMPDWSFPKPLINHQVRYPGHSRQV